MKELQNGVLLPIQPRKLGKLITTKVKKSDKKAHRNNRADSALLNAIASSSPQIGAFMSEDESESEVNPMELDVPLPVEDAKDSDYVDDDFEATPARRRRVFRRKREKSTQPATDDHAEEESDEDEPPSTDYEEEESDAEDELVVGHRHIRQKIEAQTGRPELLSCSSNTRSSARRSIAAAATPIRSSPRGVKRKREREVDSD